MKKIALVIAAICFTLNAQAQLELRPSVGTNFTNVTETPPGVSTTADVGFQGGLSAMIGNQLYFEAGVSYFTERTNYSADQEFNVDYDQTINGVNVPLVLGYRFFNVDEDPLLNPRVFAGPAAQFLTKTEWSVNETDEMINWNKYTWSALVGAGLDIDFLFVDVGYYWGLSPVAEPREQVDAFNDFRQNTFFVNVGVRLQLVD